MKIENVKKNIYGIIDAELENDLLSVFVADNDANAVRSFKAAVNSTKYKLNVKLVKLCSIKVEDVIVYETCKEVFEEDIKVICESTEVYCDNEKNEPKEEEASEV